MSALDSLRLTAKLIPIIAPFIAKGDIRYYLNGINVRPHKSGGAIICATNGHALGAIHDRNAVCSEEVNLRLDARLIQACAAGIANDRQIIAIGGRLVLIENGSTEVYIQAGKPELGGQYPRYERVVPKSSALHPGMLGSYSLKLIALVDRAAAAAGKISKSRMSSSDGVQFFNADGSGGGSAVARIPTLRDFVAVIMPMRCDAVSASPSWVNELQSKDDLAGMSTSPSAAEVPA